LNRKNIRKLGGRSKSSKTCLFISDIHDGHNNAVSTLHPYKRDGQHELKLNEDMQDVHYHWCNMIDKRQKRCYDFLSINGEPVEGEHRKTAGKGTWSNDILDQIADFDKLSRMINYTKFALTVGSGYHITIGNSTSDDIVTENLSKRGTNLMIDKNGKPIQNYFINVDIGGRLFSITHHIRSSTIQSYRSTPLASEAAGLQFLKGKLYPHERDIDVILRGHIHYYWQHDSGHQYAFVTPSWKLWDEYLLKGGLQGQFNHIGGLEIIVEPNGKITWEKHLIEKYPIPQILYV